MNMATVNMVAPPGTVWAYWASWVSQSACVTVGFMGCIVLAWRGAVNLCGEVYFGKAALTSLMEWKELAKARIITTHLSFLVGKGLRPTPSTTQPFCLTFCPG